MSLEFGSKSPNIVFADADMDNAVKGAAAGIWTENIRRALTMSKRLQAGTVWVNTYRAVSYTTPFGGYKRSGLGRELGQEAIREYLRRRGVDLDRRGDGQPLRGGLS